MMLRKLGLFIIFAALLGTNKTQGMGDGGYAGAFLRMGLGSRPQSMGGAYTAVAEGACASYYNPAGLPFLDSKELVAAFSLLSLDRKFNYIGYAQPIRPKIETGEEVNIINGGFSLGWINSGVDNIDARDLSGRPIGALSNSENAFYFSFALSPHRMVALGLSAKVLYNRFPSITDQDEAVSATGFGMDLGVLIAPFPGLTAGITIRDLKSKYTWNTERLWERATTTINRFPKTIQWGMAYRLPGEWLVLSFDLEDNDKQDAKYHLGLEFLSKAGVSLRGGLDDGDPAFGFGFEFGVLGRSSGVDYAYVSDKNGPKGNHVFSWAFRF